jgi:hypothetical protein
MEATGFENEKWEKWIKWRQEVSNGVSCKRILDAGVGKIRNK